MDNSVALAEAARMVAGMHRRSRWIGWVAVGAVAAVGVSGCADEAPEPTTPAPQTPAATAPSASSEDLLDEARATYDDYLLAAAAMWEQESVDYTLLLPYASDEIASQEAAGQTELRESGVVRVGPVALVAFNAAGTPQPDQVDAFACLDFTAADYLDAAGNDVTPAGSPDRAPAQVRFERMNSDLVLTAQEALPSGIPDPCG